MSNEINLSLSLDNESALCTSIDRRIDELSTLISRNVVDSLTDQRAKAGGLVMEILRDTLPETLTDCTPDELRGLIDRLRGERTVIADLDRQIDEARNDFDCNCLSAELLLGEDDGLILTPRTDLKDDVGMTGGTW